ncbi:hypothetical protein NGM10_11845 [Halorussus salilacus]|uniref:hypothetical protein n=1 Tax=Halorussus salilacus TaxID=2953750 RepID=UPI0020A0D296|nr:hypothetical protein [Halorussus salilacus]USZ67418.1 hypothetical protein NGM10_11845 [Halorussus salilacus]
MTSLSDDIEVYELYSRGEMDEETARALLGEKIDRVAEERDAFEAAADRDTSRFLSE